MNKQIQYIKSNLQFIHTKLNHLQTIKTFNTIYIFISTIIISYILYWIFLLWWDEKQYQNLYRQKNKIIGCSIFNFLLVLFGPIFYSINSNDILGLPIIISSFFLVLSFVLLLASIQLYRGKKDWFRTHITQLLPFLLFSIMLQWVGYIATIIMMYFDTSYKISLYLHHPAFKMSIF